MQSVKFKSKVLDKDTQIEYPISNDFVEVSDTFADRLKLSDPNGERFEFEGNNSDSELNSALAGITKDDVVKIKEEFKELQGDIDELEAEISTLKVEKETILNERSYFETQLSKANTENERLVDLLKETDDSIVVYKKDLEDQRALLEDKDVQISELSKPKVEEKASLFEEKPKDKDKK